MQQEKILLVGCGKMGTAMLTGWLKEGLYPTNITVIEPDDESAKKLRKDFGITVLQDISELQDNCQTDTVVFAVKPQVMRNVLPAYKNFDSRVLFISIAAGKTIDFFEKQLGKDTAIVRAMPNLPAVIGQGITAAYPNAQVSGVQKQGATGLLEAMGKLHWVENESLLDAVTAISGSGPAYLFYFLECLIAAGKALGLPDDLATSLAYETVHGSTELALQSDQPVSALREQVTSKGGTTEAALQILMANGLESLMLKATQAAQARSCELAE